MKQNTNEKLKCPHCGHEHGNTVDDYVIPGEIGDASSAFDECEECGQCFSVARISATEFEVIEDDQSSAEEAAYYEELNRGYAHDRA